MGNKNSNQRCFKRADTLEQFDLDVQNANQILNKYKDSSGKIIKLTLHITNFDLVKETTLWKLFVRVNVSLLNPIEERVNSNSSGSNSSNHSSSSCGSYLASSTDDTNFNIDLGGTETSGDCSGSSISSGNNSNNNSHSDYSQLKVNDTNKEKNKKDVQNILKYGQFYQFIRAVQEIIESDETEERNKLLKQTVTTNSNSNQILNNTNTNTNTISNTNNNINNSPPSNNIFKKGFSKLAASITSVSLKISNDSSSSSTTPKENKANSNMENSVGSNSSFIESSTVTPGGDTETVYENDEFTIPISDIYQRAKLDSSWQREDSRECPICFEDDAVCVAACAHAFCSKCINQWRSRNNTCPICRTISNEKDEMDFVLVDEAPAEEISSYFQTILKETR